MNRKMIAGVVLGAMIWMFCIPAFAAEMKIAYVDVAEVFDNYQKTKDQDLVLKNIGEAKEKERNEMLNTIRTAEDELALLAPDARAA